MKKVYKILELTSTSLESKPVSEEYGYGQKTLYSYLYREIDDTHWNWEKRNQLENGFNSLEEAEQFISENIGKYDRWIVVCEYENSREKENEVN